MKTIGLIGGMSWESTQYYYQQMNRYIYGKLGGHTSIEAIIYSLNFEIIVKCLERNDWDAIGDILADISKKLEAAGANFLLLTSNAAYKVVPQMEKAISIPILHIVDPTAEAIKQKHIKRVALLGTKVTMEDAFYKKRLQDHYGIEALIPASSDREILHKIIFNELTLGQIHDRSKQKLLEIIEKLNRQGAEGIILGCTELTLLVNQKDTTVPLFDTTDLHAKAAVDLAIK
ncbi:MAG TPA: aspartate/glutamate racemase family protein [Rhabdochlamydiaceae bacterium]|jgi:aspartate racemase